MSRRSLLLLSLALVTLTLSACSDATAPVAKSPAARQAQPSGAASHDPVPDDCKSTYQGSTGKTC